MLLIIRKQILSTDMTLVMNTGTSIGFAGKGIESRLGDMLSKIVSRAFEAILREGTKSKWHKSDVETPSLNLTEELGCRAIRKWTLQVFNTPQMGGQAKVLTIARLRYQRFDMLFIDDVPIWMQ